MSLSLHTTRIEVEANAGPAIVDITAKLEENLGESGISEGQLSATAIGSTASLTTIEYEPGAVADLKRAVSELAPPERNYAHEETWHDGNGHSHVQAALLGPSVVLPIRKGRLALGTWQQVILINHDIRPRRRSVEITLIGR